MVREFLLPSTLQLSKNFILKVDNKKLEDSIDNLLEFEDKGVRPDKSATYTPPIQSLSPDGKQIEESFLKSEYIRK